MAWPGLAWQGWGGAQGRTIAGAWLFSVLGPPRTPNGVGRGEAGPRLLGLPLPLMRDSRGVSRSCTCTPPSRGAMTAHGGSVAEPSLAA